MRTFAVLLLVAAVPALGQDANLLKGKVPTQVVGISEPQRMTDGVATPEGDQWKTTRTSVIEPNGSAVWDLGEAKPIGAAMLQGDNNDDYLVEGSADGTVWSVLWRVHTVGDPGMRLRQIRTLTATARFIRLTARGGDGSFSVGELELHTAPETMPVPETMKRQRGRTSDEVPGLLWAATLGLVAFLVHNKQKILWIVGAPLLATLMWASLTALLDRFVG